MNWTGATWWCRQTLTLFIAKMDASVADAILSIQLLTISIFADLIPLELMSLIHWIATFVFKTCKQSVLQIWKFENANLNSCQCGWTGATWWCSQTLTPFIVKMDASVADAILSTQLLTNWLFADLITLELMSVVHWIATFFFQNVQAIQSTNLKVWECEPDFLSM